MVTFAIKNNKQLEVFERRGPRAGSCLATAEEDVPRPGPCWVSCLDHEMHRISSSSEASGGPQQTVLCTKVVRETLCAMAPARLSPYPQHSCWRLRVDLCESPSHSDREYLGEDDGGHGPREIGLCLWVTVLQLITRLRGTQRPDSVYDHP